MLFDLANIQPAPEENETLSALCDRLIHFGQVFFSTEGEWSIHDLLEELLKHFSPAKLYISTYSITEFPARRLCAFKDQQKVTELVMLLDREFEKRYPKVNQFVQSFADRVGYSAVHAKILILEMENCCVTVLGSANWTVNPRLEAGVITTDPQVADEFKSKIISLI
jgi:hypothetical protein